MRKRVGGGMEKERRWFSFRTFLENEIFDCIFEWSGRKVLYCNKIILKRFLRLFATLLRCFVKHLPYFVLQKSHQLWCLHIICETPPQYFVLQKSFSFYSFENFGLHRFCKRTINVTDFEGFQKESCWWSCFHPWGY